VPADISQTRRKFFSPPYNFLLNKLLQRADIITTMSPQNRDGFPILRPFLNKCVIVPLAYDARHMHEMSDSAQLKFYQKHGIDPTKKIVLFAGRLSESKGIDFLIKAVGNIENIQLLIAGDGILKNSLARLADTLAKGRVFFPGYIDGRDMACAYSIADVFVLPSTSETFGIVQAEAMRFGLPVINTALNTGVNYVSIHNDTGLTVAPGDVDALATAIKTILNNTLLAKRFSENAWKRAELFSPDIMVKRFKELYNK